MNELYNVEYNDLAVQHKFEKTIVVSKEHFEHVHPYYELFLFKQGSVEFVIENKRILLNKNDLLLISPAQYHFVNFYNLNNYERVIFKFHEHLLSDYVRSLLPKINHITNLTDHRIIKLFETIDIYATEYSKNSQKELLLNAISQILISLYENSDPSSINTEVVNEKLTAILNYINNNLADKITLDTLSKRFYHSKSWIYSAFMNSLKTPPIRYIRSKRIALANSLLSKGYKPTKIYQKCGFLDYSSFYRSYIAETGYPPSNK